MKKVLLLGCFILFIACSQHAPNQESKQDKPVQVNGQAATSEKYFGEKITSDGAKPVAELKTLMKDKKELKVKLTGQVEAVCQKKGCWMNLKNANGEKLRVTFKDYKFFMPKDVAGKTAVVDGVASIEETSVSELKEFAKDSGKSKEEIAAIKEPKKELVFEASGVILRD